MRPLGTSRRDTHIITLAAAITASVMVIALQADGSRTPQDTRAIVGTTTTPIVYSPITQAPPSTIRTVVEVSTTSVEPAPVPPTDAPVPLVGPDTPCQEWIPLAIQQGWPADRIILETLASLMWRESRCTPQVVSTSHDHGLLQVNEIHRAYVEQLYGEPFEIAMSDPAKNLNFAWHLYSELQAEGKCGWAPWSLKCA